MVAEIEGMDGATPMYPLIPSTYRVSATVGFPRHRSVKNIHVTCTSFYCFHTLISRLTELLNGWHSINFSVQAVGFERSVHI